MKIIGDRLDLVTEVRFHGVTSPSVRVVTAEHLKAVVPDGATTGPIELVGPGGITVAIDRTFYVALSGARRRRSIFRRRDRARRLERSRLDSAFPP